MARVRMESAAALLASGRHERVPVHCQDPLRRAISSVEQTVHHATAQHRNGAVFTARGWRIPAALDRSTRRGEHRHRESQTTTDARQERRDRCRRQQPRKEHRRSQEPVPRKNEKNHPRDKRRRTMLIQRGAGGFQELAIRYATRTHRLAGATAKTLVDMLLHARVVGPYRSLEQRSHQENPAPRAIVLILEVEIRRARLETKSAMHARVDTGQRARSEEHTSELPS